MITTPPLYASTFDDEFSSFQSSPAGGTSSWATELPFWGSEHTIAGSNDEAEYYVDSSQANSPFTDTNGVLTIQASPASTSGGNPLGLPYNSGAITTYNSFSQLYGYFEVRAQLPAGAGLWPAFWMMPTSMIAGPELDVFEVLGNQPTILNATVHSDVPQASLLQAISVANTSTAFHTYGVDWGPQTTVFYMDGQAIATVATPADMDVPMYMLLNLAVGGASSWPGAPNAQTQFPADMKIDYVHAYQTANTIGWTDPTPSQPSPLVLPKVQAAAATGSAFAYLFVEHYGNEDAGTPLGGIGVALRNAAGLIIATGVTDSSGRYTFGNLAAGNYSVQYIMPGAYSIRPGGFADASTGVTNDFALSAGQGYGVPYQLVTSSAELAGTVQLDGTSAANVIVSLLDQNGKVISTTQTDLAGRYDFWAAAGQYTVDYDPPAGTSLVAGSLADSTTGLTAPIVLADGQEFLLIPEQLVSNASNASMLTLGSGSDTIGLSIAEDASDGDAQFTVSVDGTQIGGIQTATASQAAGATQTFNVDGNFGTGQHTVAVDFLNDANAGTPQTDRNLYVDKTTYDGSAIANGSLTLLGQGAQSIAIPSTTAVTAPSTGTSTLGSGSDLVAMPTAGGTTTVSTPTDGATGVVVADGAGGDTVAFNAAVNSDFAGNGTSDIPFQNANGSIDTWLLKNATITSGAVIANPGTSWHAEGTGDFNGDGKSDILFQNDDGTVDIWLMNGQTVTLGTIIADPGPSWHIVGAGDFNDDGKSDIVFQNNDGSVAIWEMDGTTVVAGTIIADPGPSWHVVGTGNFEGTSQTDLLLQNDDGTIETWKTNGTALTSGTVVANPGPSWHVVGSGDFNGDGKADIVLQNNNGTVNVWEMNGSTIASSTEVADPGPAWHALSVGDYNGDGKPDILFQNDDGTVETWLMKGTSVVSGSVVANPGTSWQAIGQGSMHFINETQSIGTVNGTILADDFVFTTSQQGMHIINQFDPVRDMITLDPNKFGSYAAVQAAETTVNGSTVITLGTNDTLTINGVLPSALAAKSFV